MDFAFPSRRVEENQVLLEGPGLRGHVAICSQRHARPIKYKTVVAADLVDVDHGTMVIQRNRSQHLKSQGAFVQCIRRSRNIQQHCSSLPENLGDGVSWIQWFRPKVFVVPNVLADGDAQILTMNLEDRLVIRRLEIPRFVEDIIGGQQHLALLEDDASPAKHRGLIGDGLPCSVLHAPGVTDDSGQGYLCGEINQLPVVSLDECGALQKVLGKIAAKAELGKYGQVGAALLRLSSQAQDARRISCEVADGGIELRERYFHARALGYGWFPKIANYASAKCT